MPPKQKISKEDILYAGLEIIKLQGYDFFNARNIAKKLNCSTQPIFSCYENMNELEKEIYELVNNEHNKLFSIIELDEHYFLNVGMVYVDFALNEPNLFKFLFMSEHFDAVSFDEVILSGYKDDFISQNISSYVNMSEETAKTYVDMWLYAHGISCMVIFNKLNINRDQIKVMLKNMFELLTSKKGN